MLQWREDKPIIPDKPQSVHLWTCSVCGKQAPWATGWKWRWELHEPFEASGWEELIVTCSKSCEAKDAPKWERNKLQVEKAAAKRRKEIEK
jgi:hypothetical protein